MPTSTLLPNRQAQDEELMKQFGAARKSLQTSKASAQQGIQDNQNKIQSRIGSLGGSVAKMQNKAITENERQFGAEQANLDAQEAQTKAQLGATREAADTQSEQFKQTMALQNKTLAEQLKFQYAEMDENKKTNFLNAAIAMKDAGLKSSSDWSKIFEGLSGVYGKDRTPKSFQTTSSPSSPQQNTLPMTYVGSPRL